MLAASPSGSPSAVTAKAGVHQQATDGVHPEPAIGFPSAWGCRDRADPLRSRTLIGELGRVLQEGEEPGSNILH